MKDICLLVVHVSIVAVLFVPLVVSESMLFPFITGKNFSFRIIVEIMVAAWLLLALYCPQYRPRFSWLLPAVGSLLLVMLVANFLGEHVAKSLWSNYERMDGYVTLVHFAAYFLVLGSVLNHRPMTVFGFRTTPWFMFMLTALGVAVLVSGTALLQLVDLKETTMGWRVNGTLGNAAYMAIYMLFSVFVALWVAVHSRLRWLRVVAFSLAAFFAFLLIQTATRGTILGLAGGTILGSLYLALHATTQPRLRRAVLGILFVIISLVSALVIHKDSSFVTNNKILNRVTNINLSALDIRLDIWRLGITGIAERPLLGWGQGNFNYIFDKHYDPTLAGRAEEWYDRGHNIFIDWLSNGGILALLAYLSIWVALFYYVVVRPYRVTNAGTFTVIERGLLVGIFSGYFIHNLVVFDNLVSYIFFAILLALVHSRYTKTVPSASKKYDAGLVTHVVTPVVIVVTSCLVYFMHVPSMQAARHMITAFATPELNSQLAGIRRAFTYGGFAKQELTEQLILQTVNIINNPQLPPDIKLAYQTETEQHIKDLVARKPGDARIHIFASVYYRATGELDKAQKHITASRQASPTRPLLLIEQGQLTYEAGDMSAMREHAQAAYDLYPKNSAAQVFLATALVANKAPESKWRAVLSDQSYKQFLTNQQAAIVARQTGNFSLLETILETVVARHPNVAQHHFNLAVARHENGNTEAALRTLQKTAAQFPELTDYKNCIQKNIEADTDPYQGC